MAETPKTTDGIRPVDPPPDVRGEQKERQRAHAERKAEAPPKPPRARQRRDALAGVEDRLNEMFATIAIGQAGLGIATQDDRHVMAANITSELSPAMTAAWVNLARENEAVKKVLIRLSEGTAWGEVIITTLGFAYSQAQAYGAVPGDYPNPWVSAPIVPPSPDVAQHAAAQDESSVVVGRNSADARSGVDAKDDPAHNEAERQRREVEERRRKRGS